MTEPSLPAESVFAQALEIESAAERAVFLDRACGDNPALRAEIEALLRAHEQSGDLLDLPENATVSTDRPRAARAEVADGAGTVIGPYKLLEQIGEGGMGTVWMAEQTEPIQRRVAVKVVKEGMDSKQVLARFEAERQALALMEHPHIAKVLDAGRTPSGRPYFVMELVKGQPITKYCDDKRLGVSERLELFGDVCRAVQHAHQKGIIHRDLKPSNVLVAPYDGKPVVKVIDFGVAKATGQRLTDKTLFTGFGALVGTPEYMSPEQAEVNNQDIDTRSDVYSLGVLLYELLTGSTPLTRRRVKEAALLEVLRVIREEEPPRPSTRLSESKDTLATVSAQRRTEPAKLTRLVRGELDWIVMKALDKDRNRRYETANGFAQDIQRYLADEPVLACPPSPWYQLRKFARRNKGRLAIATAVVLALTVMASSIAWAVRDQIAREAESRAAELARQEQIAGRARESANAARALLAENKVTAARQKLAEAQALLADRTALADLAAEVEAAATELDRLQQFLSLIDRAHEAETTPFLDVASVIGDPQDSPATTVAAERPGRRPAAAVPLLLEALRQYGILERKDWNTALAAGFLGRDQVEQIGRLAYEELLWLADDLLRRHQEHSSGHKLSPEAAARQVLVYLAQAERARPPTQALYALRARCRQALGEEAAFQADQQLADKTAPTIALDHYLRGQAAYDAKQAAEAVRAFEAALQLEPTHYWSMMGLGYCLGSLAQKPEDFSGAIRVFTGCLMKRPDHPYAYLCRAAMYSKLQRYPEALADGSRAIELDRNEAAAWYNRGNTHGKLGQRDQAIADYTRAIELDQKLAYAWNNRGGYFDQLGQLEKAVADFSRAIELDQKDALFRYNRGRVYDKLGRLDPALADFTTAIELDEKLAAAWMNRGLVFSKLGQNEKAVADYARAIQLIPAEAQAWYNRGVAYAALRQLDPAVADFTKAIELNARFAPAWYNRGNIYHFQNQLDKASADYSRAIELDEKLPLPWCYRSAAHLQRGQLDQAIADATRAIELDEKLEIAWLYRGLAHDKQGQFAKAIPDLSRFLELAPNHPQKTEAYVRRGLGNARLAHYAEALRDFQTVEKLVPPNAVLQNELAWLLATCPETRLRDPGQAVERAKRAVALAPKVRRHWKTLGVAQYTAGNWEAAVTALDKAGELAGGGEACSWFFLAMAYKKLGNDGASRKAYDQAAEWLEKNQGTLAKDPVRAEELRRFRSEAEEVLELKKK
jgi:tetratricopeptide (TPR) repeat protein/serine/threonine protein kinase